MKLNEIKELLKFIDEAKLQEVDLEQDNVKIKIKRVSDREPTIAPVQIAYHSPLATEPQIQAVPAPVVPTAQTAAVAPIPESKLVPVKSPMTGTFYSSPSPEKPPFVSEGKQIREGEPICIIEAMKLFNEIESEETGTIEKILVKDGEPVELHQTLFLVKP